MMISYIANEDLDPSNLKKIATIKSIGCPDLIQTNSILSLSNIFIPYDSILC